MLAQLLNTVMGYKQITGASPREVYSGYIKTFFLIDIEEELKTCFPDDTATNDIIENYMQAYFNQDLKEAQKYYLQVKDAINVDLEACKGNKKIDNAMFIEGKFFQHFYAQPDW